LPSKTSPLQQLWSHPYFLLPWSSFQAFKVPVPDDGCATFLRNVCSYNSHMV
jgi:hypothetical protein